MSFQSPEFFLFILVLIGCILFYMTHRKNWWGSYAFSMMKIVKTTSPSAKARLIELPQYLKWVAILVAIIAMARPQQHDTLIKRNVEGIDIMIALDISDSMLIEDMKPLNRMEAAKLVLKNFVKARLSDRIGIVIFAGESFTLVPLTLDYDLIVSRVSEIKTAQEARIKDGTALGVAMANAAGRLKESTAKSKVIIFMTDGENNSGTIDPITGLEMAKGYGLKVYSIGIGKDGPTRIPVYQNDLFGNKVKTYQPFESTVNEDLLKKMADDTGGRYYRAKGEDSLAEVFSDIDNLEKTKVDENKLSRTTELYPRILLISLFLYLLSFFLERYVLVRTP